MKKINLLLIILLSALGMQANTIIVSGNITTNTNWVNTNIYVLTGEVYVKNNATLSIQAGTIIQGDKNSTRPCLIVAKGAKINAVGTPELPIVFTSNQAPGSRNPGDWGGIIILGKAPINDPAGFKTIEGLPASTDAEYGGTDPMDSSGVLKYVRIEFGGIAFAANQEINGITFGGVGIKTVVENIQVSYSGDDAFEWFGGNVNCKNLVSYYNWDDDFDTDFGFSGKVQFGVAMRHPNLADISGSNGFESDNDAGGTFNNPRTSPVFSNMTIIGPKATPSTSINSNYKRAAHLRRSTLTSVFNSVFTGWPIGLFIDGSNCERAAMNDTLLFLNNTIAGCATPLIASSGGSIDSIKGMDSFFTYKAIGSVRYVNTNDTLKLTNPFDTLSPNAMPMTGSPLLSGASFTNGKLAGFENVAFKGAFGTNNWMDKWTSLTPKTNVYKAQDTIPNPTAIRNGSNEIVGLAVYPNPTTSYLNVVLENSDIAAYTIKLSDLTGKIMTEQTYTAAQGLNTFRLDVQEMNVGTYLLTVSSPNGRTSKIVSIK